MSEHADTNRSVASDPYGELLEHEYDGIHEYDNPTPGWWHVIFFATVIFCIPYMLFFHWSPMGWSIHDAYDAEMAEHNLRMFGKFGELSPDEQTIASLMYNDDFMAAMQGSFITKCASCHGAEGGGLVGPNLTDDHYKNVTKLEDIYDVLNVGITAKGMPAWGRQLSEIELILMSAYVGSLRGDDVPPGRPLEGEAIDPWPVVEPMTVEQPAPDAS